MQALSIAAAGLTAAADRFADSARRTAQDPLADPAGELIERTGAEVALRANAEVVRTAADMTDRLLDILA